MYVYVYIVFICVYKYIYIYNISECVYIYIVILNIYQYNVYIYIQKGTLWRADFYGVLKNTLKTSLVTISSNVHCLIISVILYNFLD